MTEESSVNHGDVFQTWSDLKHGTGEHCLQAIAMASSNCDL